MVDTLDLGSSAEMREGSSPSESIPNKIGIKFYLEEGFFVMTSKEIRVMALENRVNKLKSKPVENAALIKKAQRQLRKLQAEK